VAKLNVPPTKSSYLTIRRELAFAREGYDLLEQKRQILVIELMGQVEAARRVQQEVAEKMKAAFEALNQALAASGALNMGSEALASRASQQLELDSRNVMGISLSRLEPDHERPGRQFSLGHGTAASDDVVKRFYDALEVISRLAEVENAVFRLARELKKTQRRVNALEKLFIPDYAETIKYIQDTLDEREREGLVIMRMIKER
jgi:V/A-type H+-transporting ATPase subunit D